MIFRDEISTNKEVRGIIHDKCLLAPLFLHAEVQPTAPPPTSFTASTTAAAAPPSHYRIVALPNKHSQSEKRLRRGSPRSRRCRRSVGIFRRRKGYCITANGLLQTTTQRPMSLMTRSSTTYQCTPLMLILPVLRSGTAGFKQNVYKQYIYKCGR